MIGADGLEEKGINLAISLLLKSELETRGYSVAMTRETDKGLYDASANNKKAQDMQRRIAMIIVLFLQLIYRKYWALTRLYPHMEILRH